jgi:uncharacterized protein
MQSLESQMNENIINAINSIAAEYKVKRLVLFGSAVSSFDEARDIDIACEGITGKSFLRFGAKLEELFNKTVDLVRIEENSRFIEEILKDGVVLYEA